MEEDQEYRENNFYPKKKLESIFAISRKGESNRVNLENWHKN
jgi:hypothetical protein